MPGAIALDAPIPKASLADLVHQRMVAALLAGQFQAGEELNEAALAAQFHVSRTPVREALRRLAADGLVVNLANRQATVITLSRTQVMETYEVRGILESAAARLAAERMGSDDWARLRGLATAAVPPAGSAWGSEERRFDEELHRSVAEACGNEKLRKEIARYGNLVRFVRSRVGRSPRRLEQGHVEHLRILDALEARDADRAEAQMSAHIASSLRCVLEDLPLT